jgi:hypothetical protein
MWLTGIDDGNPLFGHFGDDLSATSFLDLVLVVQEIARDFEIACRR